MSEKQFYLLQVNDALFPIGGYSHSQGLETYIQRGIQLLMLDSSDIKSRRRET